MVHSDPHAIDADGHVSEDVRRIRDYLESPYDRLYAGDRMEAGSLTPADGAPRDLGEKFVTGVGGTTQAWLAMMAEGGLEKAVLYPTVGLTTGIIKDPDFAVAFCRAYNDWLSSEVCSPEQGVLGAALVAPQDPQEAAREVHRARTLGLVAIALVTDGPYLLGHRSFDPLYEAARETGLPVGLHASGTDLQECRNGTSDFPKFIQAHAVSHPFGIIRQFTSMMLEGVFERFGDVRFALLECGATWAPWYLDRLDEEFENRGAEEAPDLSRPPSTFVCEGGNIFLGCESEERLLRASLDLIGSDTLMYASDWPHWDGGYPGSLDTMRAREDLTEVQRSGVLYRGAQRFYRFP